MDGSPATREGPHALQIAPRGGLESCRHQPRPAVAHGRGHVKATFGGQSVERADKYVLDTAFCGWVAADGVIGGAVWGQRAGLDWEPGRRWVGLPAAGPFVIRGMERCGETYKGE